MTRDDVSRLICETLADILEIDPSEVTESKNFADDFDNCDSLALVELVETVEQELKERGVKVRIDDDELEDLKTVKEAVNMTWRLVSEAQGPAAAAS